MVPVIRFSITDAPPVIQIAYFGIDYNEEFEVFEGFSEFYMDFEVI